MRYVWWSIETLQSANELCYLRLSSSHGISCIRMIYMASFIDGFRYIFMLWKFHRMGIARKLSAYFMRSLYHLVLLAKFTYLWIRCAHKEPLFMYKIKMILYINHFCKAAGALPKFSVSAVYIKMSLCLHYIILLMIMFIHAANEVS